MTTVSSSTPSTRHQDRRTSTPERRSAARTPGARAPTHSGASDQPDVQVRAEHDAAGTATGTPTSAPTGAAERGDGRAVSSDAGGERPSTTQDDQQRHAERAPSRGRTWAQVSPQVSGWPSTALPTRRERRGR